MSPNNTKTSTSSTNQPRGMGMGRRGATPGEKPKKFLGFLKKITWIFKTSISTYFIRCFFCRFGYRFYDNSP